MESGDGANQERLTAPQTWDQHWDAVRLPARVAKSRIPFVCTQAGCVLEIFDAHLPRDRTFSVLEIGGAPGQYLAYIRGRFDCQVAALDFSPVGCRKTRENFALLGWPIDIHERDLFGPADDLPRYDVVYSLGFLEHFSDPGAVMARHVALLEPGGLLIVGVPVFLGINAWLVRRLSPSLLTTIHAPIMELSTWTSFERALRLTTLFRGYVGGFEPWMYWRNENPTLFTRGLAMGLRALGLACCLRPLKRINARWLSGYAMGVYRAPK